MSLAQRCSSLPSIHNVYNDANRTKIPFRQIKPSPSFVDISLADPSSGKLEFENGLNQGAFLDNIHLNDENEKSSELLNSNVSEVPPKIPPKTMIGDWVLGKTIGEGSSGKVKLAFHSTSHETCVVKAVRRPKMPSAIDKTRIDPQLIHRIHKRELLMIREAALGMVLDHPNIVKLKCTILGENYFYCFFEYISGQDLVDHISQLGRLREEEARSIFRQVTSAVEYIHRNHVVHRDIKLENIRYDPITGIAKLLDFGFATFYADKNLLATNCGSPCYASPEIYENKKYQGPEIDIWSLGVCLYGMVTGCLPFDGPNFKTLSKAVKAGKIHFPCYLSSSNPLILGKQH